MIAHRIGQESVGNASTVEQPVQLCGLIEEYDGVELPMQGQYRWRAFADVVHR